MGIIAGKEHLTVKKCKYLGGGPVDKTILQVKKYWAYLGIYLPDLPTPYPSAPSPFSSLLKRKGKKKRYMHTVKDPNSIESL